MSSDSNSPLSRLILPPTKINDTHKVYGIAAACIALCVVTCLTVITRLFFRIWKREFGADDYAIIPAALLYIGWSALAVYMNLHAGVGKPLWEVTMNEFSLWYKGIIISMWLYPVMSASIRVSTLIFYYRVFRKSNIPQFKKLIWALLAFQAIYVFFFSIMPYTVCDSFHYAWNVFERQDHCDDKYYYHTQAVLYGVSMFLDIVLLVLPIIPVAKLQMSVGKRIGVAVIFSFGAAASVVATYKLGIYVGQDKHYVPKNPTWLKYLMSQYIPSQFESYGTTFWIPSQLEPTLALIGTSLPALRKLFTQISGGITTQGDKSITPNSPYGSNISRPLQHVGTQKSIESTNSTRVLIECQVEPLELGVSPNPPAPDRGIPLATLRSQMPNINSVFV